MQALKFGKLNAEGKRGKDSKLYREHMNGKVVVLNKLSISTQIHVEIQQTLCFKDFAAVLKS